MIHDYSLLEADKAAHFAEITGWVSTGMCLAALVCGIGYHHARTSFPRKSVLATTLRFAISLIAYAVFFLRPIYTPGNPVQDLVSGSLAAVVVVFMVAVLICGPGILSRALALILLSPAAWYFSIFLYGLVEDVLHGGRVYADA